MVDNINKFLVTYAVASEMGYNIGTKKYHSFATFKADVQKAFGKTLPSTDELVIKVEFLTANRGIGNLTLKKTDYTTKLTTIETLLTATAMTLETLLA